MIQDLNFDGASSLSGLRSGGPIDARAIPETIARLEKSIYNLLPGRPGDGQTYRARDNPEHFASWIALRKDHVTRRVAPYAGDVLERGAHLWIQPLKKVVSRKLLQHVTIALLRDMRMRIIGRMATSLVLHVRPRVADAKAC